MKKLLAALLCTVMIVMLLPVSAMAAYSTTSNRGDELVAPDAGNYFKTPFAAKIFHNDYVQAIYIMPEPETGHGHLGSVMTGKTVFVLGEQNGFFYFVAPNGNAGWAWNEWFDYDKDTVSLTKAKKSADVALYPTLSTKGAELTFPDDDAYWEETETKTVKTETKCGSIYLMPMPEKGHGNLGTVACGEKVTILAEQDGFYFFQTSDGRYGWNGPDWFK